MRVFDSDGDRVDTGRIAHPDGKDDVVAIALPKLSEGAYVVTWRVISADGHPVQGAFAFRVGDAAPATDEEVAALLAARGGEPIVGVAYAAGRSIAFGALLLLVGGVVFLQLALPADADRRRFRVLLIASWLALVGATVANLGLQGAYGGGLGLADAFRPAVVQDVLRTRLGHVYVGRLLVLAAAVVLLRRVLRPTRLPAAWKAAAILAGVALCATPGLAGHASAGPHTLMAMVADTVHVSAAAAWIGGLAALLVLVSQNTETDAMAPAVRRFSGVALVSVVALVGTGVFQAWRQVGSVDQLTSTSYGRLLLVKTAVVVGILAVAALSRQLAHAQWSPTTLDRLRRRVAAEVALGVVVVVITGLLVNAVPARIGASQPQSGELASANLLLDYTITPGRAGTNEIHLYTLTKAGQQQPVEEMTLTMSLPEKDIAPIPVDLEFAGPGHYQSFRFLLPIRGRWRIDVTARTSDVDQEIFTGSVEIR